MPIISALKRLRQENDEFEANLDPIIKSRLQNEINLTKIEKAMPATLPGRQLCPMITMLGSLHCHQGHQKA